MTERFREYEERCITGALKCVFIILALAAPALANNWYVSTTGNPLNNGTSISQAWDLGTATACAAGSTPPAVIQPGDTVWLVGGTYGVPSNCNQIQFNVNGSPAAAIWFRNIKHNEPAGAISGYTGPLTPEGDERVTFDEGQLNAIYVSGSYVTIDGIEASVLQEKSGLRYLTNLCSGCPPALYPPAGQGFEAMGPGIRIVHTVIHDNAAGMYSYAAGSNVEEYGNISYYNGYIYGSEGLGHGCYQQNTTGNKWVTNNFLFDNVDNGCQFYGSNGAIVGFITAGNASFDNGSLAAWQYNLVIGAAGGNGANVFDSWYTFFPLSLRYGFVTLGQYDPISNVVHTNDVLVGGYDTLGVYGTSGPATITGNKLVNVNSNSAGAPSAMVLFAQFTNQTTAGMNWNNNQYYGGPNIFYVGQYDGNNLSNGAQLPFATWQTTTGFDSASTYTPTLPTGAWTYVLSDKYTTKRANIIVYNWNAYSDQQGDVYSPCTGACASVSVDLSSILSSGDPYKIYDVQCWYEDVGTLCNPVASGTYAGGSVSIPMVPTQPRPQPWGLSFTPSYSEPGFGAFVVFSSNGVDIPQPSQGSSALQISTGALPNGYINANYTFTMAAAGGTPPYTWSGSGFPSGISISTNGVISGTSANAGTYTPSITVTDSSSTHVTGSFPFTLSSAAPPPPCATPIFVYNEGVQVNSLSGPANVRQNPSTTAPIIGTEPNAALGTIIGGPNPIPPSGCASDILWNVQFSNLAGWVWQSLLVASGSPPPPPPTPPTAPTALTAILSGNTVDLSWTASVSSGVTGYNIYRSQAVSPASWTLVGNTAGTTFTDTPVQFGSYIYQVTALIGTTEGQPSSPSSQINIAPPPASQPAPVNVMILVQ